MPYVQNGYRAAASRFTGGIQKPKPAPWGKPANDNKPWNFPKPANDNAPRRNASPGQIGRRAISPRSASKLGGRVLPLLGAAIAGVELADAIADYMYPLVPMDLRPNPVAYTASRINCYAGPGPYNINDFGGQVFTPTGEGNCAGAVQFLGPNYTANPFADGYHWVGYITQASLAGGYATDTWIRTAGDPSSNPMPRGEIGNWEFPFPDNPWIPAEPAAVPLPSVYPLLDPVHVPIGVPLPTPQPLPVRWPLPFVDPINPQSPKRLQPKRGRQGRQRKPSDRPVINRLIIDAKGARQRNGPPYQTKPRDDYKVGSRARGATAALMNILNNVSEVNDFIEAIHGALPAHLQRHRAGTAFDVMAIMSNLHQIDPIKALRNLVENEIDDRYIGGLGMVNAATNKRLGRIRGPQSRVFGSQNPDLEGSRSPGQIVADLIFGKE